MKLEEFIRTAAIYLIVFVVGGVATWVLIARTTPTPEPSIPIKYFNAEQAEAINTYLQANEVHNNTLISLSVGNADKHGLKLIDPTKKDNEVVSKGK